MLLRLLALALIVAFSFTMFPVTVDADFSGIFDNATSVGDLDDDFDEVLRRLRPPAATDSAADVFDVPVRPTRHLPLVFAGAGSMSWTGRPPADRGPPAGLTRHPIHPAPPRVAPAARFQPDPPHVTLTLELASGPPPVSLDPPFVSPTHHFPLDHRLRSERTTQWPA